MLTRSDALIAHLPGIERVGYRHRHVRELGHGWQLLETSGWNDPPHLEHVVGELAPRWNSPVLVSHISGGDCAQIHWCTTDGAVMSAHLPDPETVGCGYLHRPQFTEGKPRAQVEAALTRWAEVAGLVVAQRRLAAVIGYTQPVQYDSGTHLSADAQVFELIHALGFRDIPHGRAYVVDPSDEPLATVATAFYGLAARARSLVIYRRDALHIEPEQLWEAEAIQLELDIYAAMYGGGESYERLAARARWVEHAHQRAKEGKPPLPHEIIVNGQTVTNTLRVVEDLAGSQIANQKMMRDWGDPFAGTGIWPELA